MKQCYFVGAAPECCGVGQEGAYAIHTESWRKWKKQSIRQAKAMRASYKPASEKVLHSGTRLETEEVGAPEVGGARVCLRRACQTAIWFLVLSCALNVVVYLWPMEEPQIEPKVSSLKPRPPLVGPLQVNSLLDEAELLFEGQFHGPESLMWTSDKLSFYTGVEGGFILRVDQPYEPRERRWSIVARLNAPQAIEDSSTASGLRFRLSNGSLVKYSDNLEDMDATSNSEANGEESQPEKLWAPFCELDQQSYGEAANWRPEVVTKSRCSRPLGLRLSPDGSRMYAVDPLSGLYLIKLSHTQANGSRSESVTRLLDFREAQLKAQHGSRDERLVLFADDLVVDWAGGENSQDLVYMSDCSRRWTLRYLLRMMIENDDSGRLLKFDTGSRILEQVDLNLNSNDNLNNTKLSFPNGLEISANGSALLLSDLNNRRVLMHHLRGPLAGHTNLLVALPGYPDNVRRGLDTLDGRPTYWAGCGCAVAKPGSFELSDDFNEYPILRKGFMKLFHFAGVQMGYLGNFLGWNRLQEWALNVKSLWFAFDMLCMHGVVVQFDDSGEILRSMGAPSHGSKFKLISEAHQVPAPNSSSNIDNSYLFLGSVYYSYMGQLELKPLFRIDNTDHIFDVNKKQHDHDQVDLVCPQQQPSPNQLASGSQLEGATNKTILERYIIYSVSKEEYESCRIDGNENRRIIAVCDQPSGRVRPVTVTFRSYTPQPNGFEYKPGQDYYFITALYNQQLDAARRFAPCREQNMKVIFKVCCKPGSSGALMNSMAASASQQQPGAASVGSLASIIRAQSANASSAPTGPRKANSQSARQTPLASTLRPILVSSASAMQSVVVKQQQQQLAALDDRLQNFVGLGGSPFSSSGQQPQPITVLPIEVHEPSSTEKEETILNDIPPPTPAPQPPAQPLPSIYQPRWPVYRGSFENRLHPTGSNLIASRYPPTPLPPWIPIRPATVSEPTKVRTSQFGMRPEPSPWLVSASRISLYPNFPSLNNEPSLNLPSLAAGNQPELLGPVGASRAISSFGWTEAAALLTVMLAIALIVMATKMRHEQRLGQLR